LAARRDDEVDFMEPAVKTIEELCAEQKVEVSALADKAGIDEQRVRAILMGRWTPSPQERDRVAGVFGLTRDQIAWGHKTPVQHIYGQGPG
jgi:transcriptional regulator with XRE-family HTH domain